MLTVFEWLGGGFAVMALPFIAQALYDQSHDESTSPWATRRSDQDPRFEFKWSEL